MLRVSGLRVLREEEPLFAALDVSLEAGQLLQIRGINGSGKTTLLRTLIGLYADYEGEIDWQLARPPLYLGHRPGISDRLTVLENLAWLCQLQDLAVSAEALEAALAEVDLQGYEDTPGNQLSAGQRRRVTLAQLSLSVNPCWILDEPFSSLDRAGCEKIEQHLAAQLARGGSIILTSHQPLTTLTESLSIELDTGMPGLAA